VTSGSSGSDRPASDRPRDIGPVIPEGITGEELDVTVTAELRTLPEELRERVARLLVASAQAIDEDPVQALAFAQAAKKHAARVAVVREAVGLSAYAAGEFALALNELRTVRRLTGSDELVAAMADAERGLNRPAKALELLTSVNEAALSEPTRIEMRLVAAGARADLGQGEAALLTLQIPALTAPYWDEPYVRLRYGYADHLARQGRVEEAATWFERIARQDTEQFTDADVRWAELSG
jgi:tetratricopeptide (TPR) repeat protein